MCVCAVSVLAVLPPRHQREETSHHQDAVDKMERRLEETVSTGSGCTLHHAVLALQTL